MRGFFGRVTRFASLQFLDRLLDVVAVERDVVSSGRLAVDCAFV